MTANVGRLENFQRDNPGSDSASTIAKLITQTNADVEVFRGKNGVLKAQISALDQSGVQVDNKSVIAQNPYLHNNDPFERRYRMDSEMACWKKMRK